MVVEMEAYSNFIRIVISIVGALNLKLKGISLTESETALIKEMCE
jgi:hypothetical protein